MSGEESVNLKQQLAEMMTSESEETARQMLLHLQVIKDARDRAARSAGPSGSNGLTRGDGTVRVVPYRIPRLSDRRQEEVRPASPEVAPVTPRDQNNNWRRSGPVCRICRENLDERASQYFFKHKYSGPSPLDDDDCY